ncbi:phytoene desaturase [Nakamurella antarctica]|uniref:Phytoene desaturase n=1 Tax=Nakamurella antarctica TaxID=1902245 RepID=A0A3G8ZXL5_9ACTN|nr:phytoene desaturase family protein [Nakamurella antarctica]AZI59164.1 phytoene desaturase [Nakamurella antarctica]
MSHIVVIGAGLAGLSAACRLTGNGHEVTVLERGDIPGGRAGQLRRDGFTFDTGPSVLTMPDLISDPLAAVGVDIKDVLPMHRLDPAYRAKFADGSTIHVRFGHAEMREEIRRTCSETDAAAFDDFVVWLRELYRVEMPHFIDHNFDSPLGLLANPKAAAKLLRMGAFSRLGPSIRKRFKDPRLQRLFSFQALYAGLAPESALALYAVITYMDSIEGVWFPNSGGMHAIPQALADAAEKAGTVFRYSQNCTEIVRDSVTGAATGVKLDTGEVVAADKVVCTVDLPVAYDTLLPTVDSPKRLKGANYSPSAVVWHVGMRGLPGPEVGHHNIHFGHEWESSFEALLKKRQMMPDPSRLVTIPTVTDASFAPAGCSSLFVLEPSPNMESDINWVTEGPRIRDGLLNFLAEQGYPTEVMTEELVTPLEWADQGMQAGTPFSLAHTFAQTGPFRPSNTDKRVPGLVFAGSGTVPGVGVPMVLISGKLAAERIGKAS